MAPAELMVTLPPKPAEPGATLDPPSTRTDPALMVSRSPPLLWTVRVVVICRARAPRSIVRPPAGTVMVHAVPTVQGSAFAAQSCVPPHWARTGVDHTRSGTSRPNTHPRRNPIGHGA